MLNRPVLLLNAGFIPIDLINVRDAVILILSKKAGIVRNHKFGYIHSVLTKIPVPEVVSLWKYNKIPRKIIKFSRLNILYRDNLICAYCGKTYPVSMLTIDHIIPRSRWKGVHFTQKPKRFNSWENVVTACIPCNLFKGNLLLKELKLKLKYYPSKPKYLPQLFITRCLAEEFGWLDFLNYNTKIIELTK